VQAQAVEGSAYKMTLPSSDNTHQGGPDNPGLFDRWCALIDRNPDEVRQELARDRYRRALTCRLDPTGEPFHVPHVGTLREQLAKVHRPRRRRKWKPTRRRVAALVRRIFIEEGPDALRYLNERR
jgi:hypothetical protein